MEPESQSDESPQYPWKAEGPRLHWNSRTPVSTLTQPHTLFSHARVNTSCAKCRLIVERYRDFASWTKNLVHYDFKSLRVSASRGCPVCRFFYDEIALQPHLQSLEHALDIHMVVKPLGQTIGVLDFSSKFRTFEIYHRRDDLQLANGRDFSSLRDVQPHPLSNECWKIAENWISTCAAEHDHCLQAATLPLPTRVIDISSSRPRLVDGIINSGPYTALSHCWGQLHRPLPYTTSNNINDFRAGVDLLDLLATFRDAVEVTRRLNIKYLWIDSLCVIRGLVGGWQGGARLVGSYYRSCFLNVSALDAPNSNTGFLVSRQAYPTVHLEENVYLRPARRPWRKVFQDSPLSRRAWVLQERLVSTRVLHYGRDDMFWECLTWSTRESDIKEHRLTDQDAEWLDENFKRSLQYSQVEGKEGIEEALRKWYKVVSQYSRLAMSHESDMLPAISGIAERIQQATRYTYLAGLWLEDISQGLLWYADGPRSAPRIWRAPSWSWAQLIGPVIHPFSTRSARVDGKYDLKITDYFVSSTIDKALKDAALHIIGYTAPVWLKTSHGNPPYNNPSLKLIIDIYDQQGMPIGTGHLDTFFDDSPIRHCDALAISERMDEEVSDDPWLFFLLIEPVHGQADLYRRIGIAQTLEPFHQIHFDWKRVFDEQLPKELTLI